MSSLGVTGAVQIIMFYCRILSSMAEYDIFKRACTPANTEISLSNYFYFFLDVHE
jgi:hypothetical protein